MRIPQLKHYIDEDGNNCFLMKGPNGKTIKVEYQYLSSDSDDEKDAFDHLEFTEKDIAKVYPPKAPTVDKTK